MDQEFLRRPHRKSRFGCQQCKRRHVKCDEVRPACTNCTNGFRECVYRSGPLHHQVSPTPAQNASTPSPLVSALIPSASFASVTSAGSSDLARFSMATQPMPRLSPSPLCVASEVSLAVATPPPAQEGVLYQPLNMLHIKLFNHFIYETGPSLDPDVYIDSNDMGSIMPAIVSAPYLTHQILALAALHLAHLEPKDAKRYREEATALQTQALFLLNNNSPGGLPEITADTCVPMLFFASFLGLHALAEAVTSSESDADSFVERFISYINLHRGVRAVVNRSWALLKRSEIFSVLNKARNHMDPDSSRKGERAAAICNHLYGLLEGAELGPAVDEACRDAICTLQPVLELEEAPEAEPTASNPGKQSRTVGIIWAWPILLSGEFTSLLIKRNPEALIILAHYAALLHRRRHTWLVGNAGSLLIHALTRHLGTYWSPWLRWPNEVLLEG